MALLHIPNRRKSHHHTLMTNNFLNQVQLQYALEMKEAYETFPQDPEIEALNDATISELTELLNADKFYEC